MAYEEKDIVTYHTNGVIELLLRFANDETNRRKRKGD